MIKIGNKEIGGRRVYIIAEFGVNHNGSLERAKEGIKKAAEAGADAIKFQTYTANELVVKGTPKFWKSEGGDVGKDQYEAYAALGGFPYEYYEELMTYAAECGIELISTPFSFEAADFLDSIGVKAFKIASSDMSCLPFLRHVARFQKPILLSTGAATLREIQQAIETIEECGNSQIILLQCTLCYPTKEEDANLSVISNFKREWDYPVGISDHTLGAYPSIIAAAAGASVIEKHYTVDKTLPDSADHWLSVDPAELQSLVVGVRHVETLLGDSYKKVLPCESRTRQFDKRSIVSKVDIVKGQKITEDMLTYKRPGTGIWPENLYIITANMQAKGDILADTTLQWSLLE